MQPVSFQLGWGWLTPKGELKPVNLRRPGGRLEGEAAACFCEGDWVSSDGERVDGFLLRIPDSIGSRQASYLCITLL